MVLLRTSCRFRLGVTDFDLRKAPAPEKFGPFYETVHPFGDEWEDEQEAMVRLERKQWREKLVVDDIHFHTHRCVWGREGICYRSFPPPT